MGFLLRQACVSEHGMGDAVQALRPRVDFDYAQKSQPGANNICKPWWLGCIYNNNGTSRKSLVRLPGKHHTKPPRGLLSCKRCKRLDQQCIPSCASMSQKCKLCQLMNVSCLLNRSRNLKHAQKKRLAKAEARKEAEVSKETEREMRKERRLMEQDA